MATNVQKKIESIETTLYHHGLVNILVEFHLRSIGDTWEDFLVRNFFQDAPDLFEESHVKKSRRRNINIDIQSSTQKDDAKIALKPEVRKQTKEKRKMKERVEEINKDIPEPSSAQEDEQLLSERLTKTSEQSRKTRRKERGKRTQKKKPYASKLEEEL